MSDSGTSNGASARTVASPAILYVTPAELAKQLAYRDTGDVRLSTCCAGATDAIDRWCGRESQMDPTPPVVASVALSLAVDMWKQPDATFGIMGMGETGPVRVARDLVMRYDALLIPYYGINGWGVG